MPDNHVVDIIENTLLRHGELLELLLIDRTRTTRAKTHHIIWGTNSYPGHRTTEELTTSDITGKNTYLIQPRIAKTQTEQKNRTKQKAEVFTPRQIVKLMNQNIDQQSKNYPINQENWQKYIQERWLEITCGEAPYIVNRYDAANGEKVLKLNERVGFLDRKLQTVTKYAKSKKEWLEWSINAFKASYGYEWQGDNLVLARENLLYTFIDYWNDKFPNDKINLEQKVTEEKLKILIQIATIISWNIFQMDGINDIIPMSGTVTKRHSNNMPPMLLMLGEKPPKPKLKPPTYVKIMDWQKGKTVKFKTLTN